MSKILVAASRRHSRHHIETKQCPSLMVVLFDQYQTAFETWEISQGRCVFLYCMAIAQFSKFLAHLLKGVVSLALQLLANFAFVLQIKLEKLSYRVVCCTKACGSLLASIIIYWRPSSIVLCVVTSLRKSGKCSLFSETILDHAAFCIRMLL